MLSLTAVILQGSSQETLAGQQKEKEDKREGKKGELEKCRREGGMDAASCLGHTGSRSDRRWCLCGWGGTVETRLHAAKHSVHQVGG